MVFGLIRPWIEPESTVSVADSIRSIAYWLIIQVLLQTTQVRIYCTTYIEFDQYSVKNAKMLQI